MKKVFLLILIIFSLVASAAADAAKKGDVVINEIAWMGTSTSANDEWIELYNTTDLDINLSGWRLVSADGKIKANLKGYIIAKGYYLMERTDDTSLPEVPADVIYTGALNNVGQNLTLSDAAKNSIDQLNFQTRWPAGSNVGKQTMERNIDTWHNSKAAGGTPKAENTLPSLLPSPQKTDTTYLSALSEPVKTNSSNPWGLFLTAFGITSIAGITIILLKMKAK